METSKNEKIQQMLLELVGHSGRMIGWSKSRYAEKNSNNCPIFNANICIKEEPYKVWYGDIDLTLSRQALRQIAVETDTDIYVLRETDARFEHEKNPRFEYFAYCAKSDGTEELGVLYKDMYKIKDNELVRQKQRR